MKIQKDPPQKLFFLMHSILIQKKEMGIQSTANMFCIQPRLALEEKPKGHHQDILQVQGEQECAPT